MKIAIVDDRAEDRALLCAGLERWAQRVGVTLDKAEEFPSAEAFLAVAGEPGFDLVFLDIYMDGITGMEAARRIRESKRSCHIVFTSVSSDFGVESYTVQASYYLLKPFDDRQLNLAMERCGAAMLEQNRALTVPGRFGSEKLLIHRVAYAEYVSRRVVVYFSNGQEMQINMNWNEFAAMMLCFPFFCDCMKGMLVSFEAVKKLTEDSFLLQSGQTVPISRLKYKDVRKQFIDWSYEKARSEHI